MGTPATKPTSRPLFIWKILAVLLLILSVALLIALIVLSVQLKQARETLGSQQGDTQASDECPGYVAKENSPASRGEVVFKGLSVEETASIFDFMLESEDLNLVSINNATLESDYVYSIEDHLPPKQDVVNWLDQNSDTPPTRKARVIVFFGSTKEVKEYLVWPIPNPTNKEEAFINRPENRTLTWASRPICNTVEVALVSSFMNTEFAPLNTLFRESFQAFEPSCASTDGCIYWSIAARVVPNSNDRHYYIWYNVGPGRIEDYYVYPLNFFVILSTPGNGNQFAVKKLYYNNMKYDSVADLANAYENIENIRLTFPDLEKSRGRYGSPRYIEDPLGITTDKRPPQQFSPDGNRFSVNGHHISYMNWEFDYHTRTVAGLQLFNVRYREEKVAYEISFQDIFVLYSGGPPDDLFKSFFDNGWATGRMSLPLIRGIDCPHNAAYLDNTVFGIGTDDAFVIKDGICVFEHTNSIPLRRHFSADFHEFGYRFLFGMPDSVLIVRQIITVWNYDYIIDFEFHQNGAIESKVSSTGYIQFANNVNGVKHGYNINPDWPSYGLFHQHLFNFRFDLDAAGQSNRFKTINFVSESLNNSQWVNGTWYTPIMEEEQIETEAKSALQYDFQNPKYFVIYNENEALKGQKKGYRIHSGSFTKIGLPVESPLLAGASWAKYQVAVTKYSEKERTTASYFTQGDPYSPAINFDDFISNDNLVDEDLVAWVTVGLNHAPSFEDLPVTTTPGKTVGAVLLPYMFYDRDPSIFSKDAATFWNKQVLDLENQHLENTETCLPKPKNPFINI